MKRIIQIMLFGAICISQGTFAQSSSKWQPQSIMIDGNGSDWGTVPRFFNAESSVKYEFRNDAQNLYIILNAASRQTQMQMQMAGFNVKLKVKSSTPLKAGIQFPGMKKEGMPPKMEGQDGKPENLSDQMSLEPKEMPKDTALLDGFLFAKGKVISDNDDQEGIGFARNKSNRDQACYEIRIPLRELFGNNYSLESVTSTTIQLQVVINELSTKGDKRGKGGMRGNGMRGGHGGGGPGGGDHGGMGGGPGGGGPGGDMGGDMGGGMPGGGEMGGGQEMDESSSTSDAGTQSVSTSKKTFNIDFILSSGK